MLAASTVVRTGDKVNPHWALPEPRYLQSPLLEGWRRHQKEAGVPAMGAVKERAKGLGDRKGKPDERPLLIDDAGLVARVWSRVNRGEAFTGLKRPITGRPNRYWREWEKSGARGDVLRWLRDGGYMFEFTGDVEPVDLGGPGGDGNGQGVHDPEYVSWLHRTIEELVVLGVLEETKHRPFVMNKLSVVQKSGYDAVTNPNRLRLVLDQRPLNVWLEAPKYSHESLYSARDVIEPDDCILQTDIRQGYWHGLAHVDAKEYMGFQIGGRYFRWRATPMRYSTSSYVFQATQWVLSKNSDGWVFV